jgi:hypothetical protein
MVTMLKALYHRLAPDSLRVPFWHLRTGIWQFVRGNPDWRGRVRS